VSTSERGFPVELVNKKPGSVNVGVGWSSRGRAVWPPKSAKQRDAPYRTTYRFIKRKRSTSALGRSSARIKGSLGREAASSYVCSGPTLPKRRGSAMYSNIVARQKKLCVWGPTSQPSRRRPDGVGDKLIVVTDRGTHLSVYQKK